MEYSVNQLAKLSGVSARALRYYDQIGLLKPDRVGENGYRVYGQTQVDLLQQILCYRTMGVELETIKALVYALDFDRRQVLERHMFALKQQKAQIDLRIKTVGKTICALKGELIMNDSEKFAGFQQELLRENEARYGAEIRDTYGDEIVDVSNQKFSGMTQTQWEQQQTLSSEILKALAAAMKTGDPAGAQAQQMCALHEKWLRGFWNDTAYTRQAHRALAQMYVDDARFTAYYDAKAGSGVTLFLKAALDIYTQ